MPKNIRARVGAGAPNHTGDVRTVQYLLNCVPARRGGPERELAVDGEAGERTLHAVARFLRRAQSGSAVFTPRGAALRALQEWDPYPDMKLPDLPPRPPSWEMARPRTVAETGVLAVTVALAYVWALRAGVQANGVALGLAPWERELERAAANVGRVMRPPATLERESTDLDEMLRQALDAAAPSRDLEAAFGYPRGLAGRSAFVRRLAEIARTGARRAEWPGTPGGDRDGLWRSVHEWLEARPWP